MLRPALLLAALFAVSLVARPAAAGTWIGGASTAKDYVNAVIGKIGASGLGQYSKSTSKDGIDQFNSNALKIGVSDVPMDPTENKVLGGNKLTVPTFIATFSFVGGRGGKNGLALTGAQLVKIFRGSFTDWSQVSGMASGSISVVARGDASGSTNVITTYLSKVAPRLWPAAGVGFGPFTAPDVWGSSVTLVSGSDAVCAQLQTSGQAGIGYLQTGIGVFKCGLTEFKIQNKAGHFVAYSLTPNINMAVPKTFPKPSAPWAPVFHAMIFAKGPATYPIVGLEYFFYKKSYVGDFTGKYVKGFGVYSLSVAGQALIKTVFATKLTPAATHLLLQNRAAVKTIRI